MLTMKKPFAIVLVCCALVSALGLGIFLASNQTVQQGSVESQTTSTHQLTVNEISKDLTVPEQLGRVHYIAKDSSTLLFYSTRYETIRACTGTPIAELKITDQKIAEDDLTLTDPPKFVHITLSQCPDKTAEPLFDAFKTMVAQ